MYKIEFFSKTENGEKLFLRVCFSFSLAKLHTMKNQRMNRVTNHNNALSLVMRHFYKALSMVDFLIVRPCNRSLLTSSLTSITS